MRNEVLRANEAAGTRLELLLFRLNGKQLFGINVFKVQAITPAPALTRLDGAHPLVLGIARIRDRTLPIMDLSEAVALGPLERRERSFVIVAEYNRSVHGFLVQAVDRIAHTEWNQVLAPPWGIGREHFLSAVTHIDDKIVQVLDVEKVLDQVVHASTRVDHEIIDRAVKRHRRILVVDDSVVARKQVVEAMEQIGVECVTAVDGADALDRIAALRAEGGPVDTQIDMIISDIEMPKVDGYMLVTALRRQADCAGIYILLHSSISGEFNIDMVRRTGANRFIQKYDPDELAVAVMDQFAAESDPLARSA